MTPALAASLGVAGYVLAVLALTMLTNAGRVRLGALAATPAGVEHGKVWTLFSSGLLVEGNLALSLLGVLTLGLVGVHVCGGRRFCAAAVAGHIGSAVCVYAALECLVRVGAAVSGALLRAPDYGISTLVSGGLGALTLGLWEKRRRPLLRRLWLPGALLCAGSIVFMTFHQLDPFWIEHVPAYLLGIAAAHAYGRLGGERPVRPERAWSARAPNA